METSGELRRLLQKHAAYVAQGRVTEAEHAATLIAAYGYSLEEGGQS